VVVVVVVAVAVAVFVPVTVATRVHAGHTAQRQAGQPGSYKKLVVQLLVELLRYDEPVLAGTSGTYAVEPAEQTVEQVKVVHCTLSEDIQRVVAVVQDCLYVVVTSQNPSEQDVVEAVVELGGSVVWGAPIALSRDRLVRLFD
jgi:hypothetical protein